MKGREGKEEEKICRATEAEKKTIIKNLEIRRKEEKRGGEEEY